MSHRFKGLSGIDLSTEINDKNHLLPVSHMQLCNISCPESLLSLIHQCASLCPPFSFYCHSLSLDVCVCGHLSLGISLILCWRPFSTGHGPFILSA